MPWFAMPKPTNARPFAREPRHGIGTRGVRPAFQRVRQPVEPDRGDRGAQLSEPAGEVARRRVVRDAGPAGNLAQPEAGDAFGLEDLDGALEQALPGVRAIDRSWRRSRSGHVDSVHIAAGACQPRGRYAGPGRCTIATDSSSTSMAGRAVGRVVPARVTARVAPSWRGTSTTETIVPARASYSTTSITAE